MYFTRVRMMNIPYFMFRNIEKMEFFVNKKPYAQQLTSIYHFSLTKIIVLHELNLLNMPWDFFISHDIFKVPQIFSSVPREEGGPLGLEKVKETQTIRVLVFVTYWRGTRKFFSTAR